MKTLLEKLDGQAEMKGLSCRDLLFSITTSTTTTTSNRNLVAAVTHDEDQSATRHLFDPQATRSSHGSRVFAVSNDRNRWERSYNPNPPNRWINAINQQNRSTTQNSSPTITGSKRPRSEITCFKCAEKGHYQREFPIRMRSQEIEATLKRQRTTDDRFIAPSKQPAPPQPVAVWWIPLHQLCKQHNPNHRTPFNNRVEHRHRS